jgi:hypothetical protein
MKKLITIAAGLLIAGSAFANTVTLHRDTKISSADYATKAEALNAGYDIAENLTSVNQNDLRKEFHLFGDSSVRNITVDQTEIQAEEFSLSRDEIQYRAVVNVNYHFEAKDND